MRNVHNESPSEDGTESPRVFVREPGWRIGHKVGSTREFCYMMAPGQDFYHRLLDGEVFLFNNEERLCFACAQRRGLLSHAAKGLREPLHTRDRINPEGTSEFEVPGLESDR
ncbi:MAG: hypothetical protein P4L84_30215 [Isosphaeraceae bacterium]|nr:hypothetical protein [Isosphaeraceae bacterium]